MERKVLRIEDKEYLGAKRQACNHNLNKLMTQYHLLTLYSQIVTTVDTFESIDTTFLLWVNATSY